MFLGAHIGVAAGLPDAVLDLKAVDGEAIQIFSKSPQMWAGPPIAPEAAASFRAAVVDEGLRATAVHHGYLVNLASPKTATLARSCTAFHDEMRRAELLGVDALIFHPGAHLGSGVEAGLASIAKCLSSAIEELPDGKTRLLLENAAGQGTTLGSNFEQLQTILETVNAPHRLGVTIDTCHLFASGVDFRTPELYGRVVDSLRDTVGLETVRAFHLNDAKADLGSHLDRHENIGKGQIGLEGFRHVLADPNWANVPGYLETPLDDDDYARYAEDLRTLRSLVPEGSAARRPPRGRPRARAEKSGNSSKAGAE
jgi:deoxyribonuclease IV